MRRLGLTTALLGILLYSCSLPAPPETPTPGAYAGCYYVWATRELPQLSQKFNRLLQEINPDLAGSAYAFGEDCVYEDGHSDFLAKETDFRVFVSVKSLRDEAALGTWILVAMRALDELPPAEIPGPQPGRVEFTFEKNKAEELRLQVSIREYRDLPPDLSPAEIFRKFHINP